jgi:LysR family transcriptional regulator, transcriptional activator for dmlA
MQERDVVAGMGVFVAVVEGGSFTAAAKQTGLTPSAVSKLIARLEAGFGAPLLRRTTRRMALTEAGQTFFERARTILDDLRALEDEMSSNSAEPRGLLRISASQLLGQVKVLPVLLAFMKKTPTLSCELDLTDRVVDMVGERIDVAVRITSDPPPSFVARRVGAVRRVLCASPAYLRAHGTPKVPRDLADQHCLTLLSASAAAVWSFPASRSHPPDSVRVGARLRFSNTLAIYEAAKAGLGVADLPRYLVEDDLRARRLITLLEPFEMAPSGVFVVYGAGPLLPARVRAVADCLVRELPKALS